MSGQPSLSKSPTATPDPFSKTRLDALCHSATVLLNVTPVCSGDSSVNPVFPVAGSLSSTHRPPGTVCHDDSTAGAVQPVATTAPAIVRRRNVVTQFISNGRSGAAHG